MLFISNKNLSVVERLFAVKAVFTEPLVLLFLCKSLHCYTSKLRAVQFVIKSTLFLFAGVKGKTANKVKFFAFGLKQLLNV